MRKHIIILILAMTSLAGGASAQHYLGVSGGYGGGGIRLFPQEETGMKFGLYSAGLSYKFYFDPKYVGGVGADVLWLQQGYTQQKPLADDSTRTYSRTVNSVMVPLFWQPHINLFRGHARFFLNLGLTFSCNYSSNYKLESGLVGLIDKGQYDMQVVRDNMLGYGLCGGAGINVAAGHFEMSLEARYYYGYSDILRNRNKFDGNPLRSPLDNINISMAMYYRFGPSVIEARAPKVKKQKAKKNGDGNNAPTEGGATNTERH